MSLSRKLNIVRESIATFGVGLSFRYLMIHLLSYDSATDHSFDEQYGTDTSGIIDGTNVTDVPKEPATARLAGGAAGCAAVPWDPFPGLLVSWWVVRRWVVKSRQRMTR